MRILDCYFADYFENEIRKIAPEEIEDFETCIEPLFVFALVWSIGCTTNLEGREKFDRKVRELVGKDLKYPLPVEGTVYDYMFDKVKKEWIIWTDTVPPY